MNLYLVQGGIEWVLDIELLYGPIAYVDRNVGGRVQAGSSVWLDLRGGCYFLCRGVGLGGCTMLLGWFECTAGHIEPVVLSFGSYRVIIRLYTLYG